MIFQYVKETHCEPSQKSKTDIFAKISQKAPSSMLNKVLNTPLVFGKCSCVLVFSLKFAFKTA